MTLGQFRTLTKNVPATVNLCISVESNGDCTVADVAKVEDSEDAFVGARDLYLVAVETKCGKCNHEMFIGRPKIAKPKRRKEPK